MDTEFLIQALHSIGAPSTRVELINALASLAVAIYLAYRRGRHDAKPPAADTSDR